MRMLGGVVAVTGLLLLAGFLQQLREQAFPAVAQTPEALYVTSGRAARHLALGYTALAADLYWIRAIQYFGGTKLRLAALPQDERDVRPSGEYPLLYPLLDLTTELDPRFNIAYRFGAIFLAEPYPGGAGRPDLAIRLLEKGLAARPDKWEYMQDIGFVHYWWLHDYAEAARWFNRATEVPDAPWFLRSLAATTLAEGGDRSSSRTMWEAIRASADNDWLRSEAERRLQQLETYDLIEGVQRQVDRAKASGADVGDWEALRRARLLRQIPLDPSGTPLRLDQGVVRIAQESPLFPLPDEPQRAMPLPQ
ncbi:MAG: hypothetical protein AB7Q29_00115 [Vicinamibacterales bacterium]